MFKIRPVVELIIPGLFNLPLHELEEEQLRDCTPCLHRMLRFSDQHENQAHDLDSMLISRLDLKQSGLPYAYAVNATKGEHQVVFKPVFLKSDINNAIVFPLKKNLEINRLIKDLSGYFKEDCDISALPQNYWLMTFSDIQADTGLPHYLTAVGKKVTHYLEQSKKNLAWFKLFNEMQMFLYQHDINQQQQQVNSLWCWGSDDYRGESFSDLQWFSDDYLMQRLGELYTRSSSPLNDFKVADIDKRGLVIDLSILNALKGEAESNLLPLLTAIEQRYLKPIVESRACELHLLGAGKVNLRYTPSMSLKVWKKRLSLASFQ